jgi:hypothetical protein
MRPEKQDMVTEDTILAALENYLRELVVFKE